MKRFKKIFDSVQDIQEFILLLFLFGISLFFFVISLDFHPRARVFPAFTSGITIFFILLHFIKEYFPKEIKESLTGKREAKEIENRGRILLTALLFVLYIIISFLFGFYISVVFLTVLYPLFCGTKNIYYILATCLFGILCVYVFEHFTYINLMRGYLIDLSVLFNLL